MVDISNYSNNSTSTSTSLSASTNSVATSNAPVKPVATTVNSTTTSNVKEVKPMAVDPKGMFDYSNCKQVTVKDGQSLFDIAQDNAVALQQLRYFNHLNRLTRKVKVGQVIYIPDKPITVPTGE